MFPSAFSRLASVVIAGSFLGGCDLIDSVTATTIVGGLVVATPAVSVPGQVDVPAEVLATAWVAERDSVTSSEEPRPVGVASVQIAFDGVAVDLPVQNASAGVYVQDSITNPALTFVQGAQYTLEARFGGGRFGGSVTAPAALTAAAMILDPSPTEAVAGLPEVGIHPRNTPLSLSWSPQFGRYAYVTVLLADPDQPQNPFQVFDNRPRTTTEILDFVVGTPETQQQIPASVFAENGLYAVILVAMDNTDNLLPNTFVGSPVLVGSGAVVFVAVGQL